MYENKNSVTAYLPVRFLDSTTGLPVTGVLYSGITSATVLHSDNTTADVTPASISDFFEVSTGAFANTGTYLLRVTSGSLAVNGFLSYAVKPSLAGVATHVGVINTVANLEVDTYTRVGAPAGASVSADVAAVQTVVDSTNTKSTAIQAKTDNLPSDPADQSQVEAAITAATSPLSTSAALTTVGNNVVAVKAKTDNLPSDPADQSILAAAIADVKSDTAPTLKFHANRRKKYADGPNANQTVVYEDDGTTEFAVFDMLDDDGDPTFSNPVDLTPVP